MADVLFPVTESPEFVSGEEEYDSKYRPSVSFDVEKGDFVLNGNGDMQECSGVDAYRTWCVKMAFTERYECLAYPRGIGAEITAAMSQPTNDAVELDLERTIREAIMVNPRTESVSNFEFVWNGDELHVSFVVKGKDIDEFTVEI